ncbi:radical SAM protein [Parafrankia discariae]|uniref:radical SAM protein n=1 Tax=Parafrankia discariae TaxID=365528 RepID=UPI0003A9977A|nr:radical SAM protein [Parafrankia discariae]
MTVRAPSLTNVARLAAEYAVPIPDVLLMALNLHGLATDIGNGRARMEVRLDQAPAQEWHVIVPTGQPASEYEVAEGALLLSGQPVGTVRLVEHDDAKLGYFRDTGRVITANTNRRSTCTGCVFCPNTMTDANDPRIYREDAEIRALLTSVLAERRWADLSSVREINLSTGCFGEEARALAHLAGLRAILGEHGFGGRLGILTSVIRSAQGLRTFADVGPAAVFLTLECLTRRDVLLKDTKADLTPAEAIQVLRRAREAGVSTGVMLVIGLDDLTDVADWLSEAALYLTDFPNLQIFQSHSPFMSIFRMPGADTIEYFLTARKRLEAVLLPTGLRPQPWQNYRPLWHYGFGSERLLGS